VASIKAVQLLLAAVLFGLQFGPRPSPPEISGTVSGRVSADGQNVVGMEIVVIEQISNLNGERSFRIVAAGQSNDRGEYLIAGVNAGSYYVTVGAPTTATWSSPTPASVANRDVLKHYGRVYYPSARDINAASVIEVKQNMVVANIDFALSRVPLYRVSGRILVDEKPPSGAMTQIVVRGLMPGDNGVSNFNSVSFQFGSDGRFAVKDLPSGKYHLEVSVRGDQKPVLSQGVVVVPPPLAQAVVPLNVIAADISDFVIRASPPGLK
jgi:hypothetical protein